MLAFIEQYWLNFLLGIISGGLILFAKKIWALFKESNTRKRHAEQETLQKEMRGTIKENEAESKKGDEILQDQIDIMKSGILSIQRKIFKQECRELLKEDHEITLEEFEGIQEDHRIYNSLGGNHDGDALFEMVRQKATNNIADQMKNREP